MKLLTDEDVDKIEISYDLDTATVTLDGTEMSFEDAAKALDSFNTLVGMKGLLQRYAKYRRKIQHRVEEWGANFEV